MREFYHPSEAALPLRIVPTSSAMSTVTPRGADIVARRSRISFATAGSGTRGMPRRVMG